MTIRLEYRQALTGDADRDGVWQLLVQCDKEFVPPLSARESSFQSELNAGKTEIADRKPYLYFEGLKDQHFLLGYEAQTDELVGFMSFRNGYTCEELADCSPSNYITTLCVSASFRNRGISRRFYEAMEKELPAELRLPYLSTRTWSLNDAHIHLLHTLNFEVAAKLPDHRGAGIDTLYFAKRLTT